MCLWVSSNWSIYGTEWGWEGEVQDGSKTLISWFMLERGKLTKL